MLKSPFKFESPFVGCVAAAALAGGAGQDAAGDG